VKIIDVHNHLYPKDWMAYLEGKKGAVTMERTGPTDMVFYYHGVRLATVNKAGHYDPAPRIADLDEYGIDVQMVSLTTPSVELIPAAEGVMWATKVNDYYAEMCEEYKGRLYGLATLPYQDVPASVRELERAHDKLGVKGITMFSNIAGKPIYSPEFLPIFEAAEGYGMPIFIHPAPPVTTDAMIKVQMPLPLYAFILDTTMAVTGLIFHGVLARFPGLKIIHAHLGGVVPYLVGRLNDCYRSYKDDYGFTLQEQPSEYYKRNVYVDTISFHLPAMQCALDFLGPDHLMVGTDYAHPIGGPDKIMAFIKDLNLSQENLEKVLWKNAAQLFGLEV
jgi:predicted TIM-barrel fold metal-dependent hydrolase